MDPLLSRLFSPAVFAAVALLFWPDGGLLARWRRSRRQALRARMQDALTDLFQSELEDLPATLPPIAGAPLVGQEAAAGVPLDRLNPGQRATVLRLSPGIRGAERRRLMDLGLLPGTEIKAELRSPSGDPTAYLVRGALLALRAVQARHIRVRVEAGAVKETD